MKPREFWIIKQKHGGLITRDHKSNHVDSFYEKQYHVIEHSAYQDLETKLAVAVAALEEVDKVENWLHGEWIGDYSIITKALIKIKGEK